MPRYDYKCPVSGLVQERIHSIADLDKTFLCVCGEPQIRLISTGTMCNPDWEPYLDENLGHEPVLVKSRAHRIDLMKRRGLVDMYGQGARK